MATNLWQSQPERGEPWFDDGNVILLTDKQPTVFRLHRGVLARHSEVFADMFGVPQPSTLPQDELYEDCQVVRMYDIPIELSNLAKALYDGPIFHQRDIQDFFHLAGVLRLATKYFIGHIRRAAVAFLHQTWASTLAGHDTMVDAALLASRDEPLSFPYVHPLHVLNLARELDLDIIIPSALYFLSLYPLSDILKGDHPKLLVDHPSKPSSTLSSSDLQLYTLMFQHRINLISSFLRRFCGSQAPIASSMCFQSRSCSQGFAQVASQVHRSWSIRTGPLHFISQSALLVATNALICDACRRDHQREISALRQTIWDELPTAVGMPGWPSFE